MSLVNVHYEKSIMGLMGSILKKYGLPYHYSNPLVDSFIEDDLPVVFLLLDGLSMNTLELLEEDALLRKGFLTTVESVFPTTTTSATTSLMSHKHPLEHGWLGWNLYFKELPYDAVTVFLNEAMNLKIPLEEDGYAFKELPYETVFTRLEEKGVKVEVLSPFMGTYYEDLPDLFRRIEEAVASKDFIYAYHTEPDYLTHHVGSGARELKEWMEDFETLLRKFSHLGEKCHFFIFSDHGHIDSKPIYLEDYPEIYSLLRQSPSMEMRASALFIKEGQEDTFKRLFTETFKDFLLLSKKEVLDSGLLGFGEPHRRVTDFLGDFLAISVGGYHLEEKDKYASNLLSQHGGLTPEERLVPLIKV